MPVKLEKAAKPVPIKLEKAAKPVPVKVEASVAPIKVETSLAPKPAEESAALAPVTSMAPAPDALALPAMPPVPPESDDYAPRPLLPQPEKVRTAAILVATGVLATLGWIGVYLMAFGNGDAAADVASAQNSVPVGLTPGGTADFVVDPSTGQKLSTAARARAAAAELPKGQLTQQQKRIALQNYTAAIGLDLTNAASPTTAARSACRLLGTGTEPEDLVKGVAKGGRITKAKSRAFLLGATMLYCPTESKPFKR